MSGRKTRTVTVPSTGENWSGKRDAGKIFLITEMPAMEAEKWAYRAFFALKGTNERIPENIAAMGMVGIALVGLNTFLQADIKPEVMEPLLDQMMGCVKMVRDNRHPDVATPITGTDDILEIQTVLWLRSQIIELHTDFSPADALWTLISAMRTATI